MDKMTIQRLQEDSQRLNEFYSKNRLEKTEEYRYFIIFKKNREFLLSAVPKDKDLGYVKLRYNAPYLQEIGVHEYFELIYEFYGGVVQYFKY